MTETSGTKRPFAEVVNTMEVVDIENESPANQQQRLDGNAIRSPIVQPEQSKENAKSPRNKKKTWTKEEDEKLRSLVQAETNQEPKWTTLAKSMGIRTGKQCRERWHQHLRPGLIKGNWTAQEDALIAELQGIHGNKWSKIAESMPHRTDNDIKNRWNSKRKQERNRARLLAQGLSLSAGKRGKKSKKTRRYTKRQAKQTTGKQFVMSSFALARNSSMNTAIVGDPPANLVHSRIMTPSNAVFGSATHNVKTPPDVLSFILGASSIEYKSPWFETPPMSLSPLATPKFTFSPSSTSSSHYRDLENCICSPLTSPLTPQSLCFVPATLLTPPFAIPFREFVCSPIE